MNELAVRARRELIRSVHGIRASILPTLEARPQGAIGPAACLNQEWGTGVQRVHTFPNLHGQLVQAVCTGRAGLVLLTMYTIL